MVDKCFCMCRCPCGKPAVGYFLGHSNIYAGLYEVDRPKMYVCEYHKGKAIKLGEKVFPLP